MAIFADGRRMLVVSKEVFVAASLHEGDVIDEKMIATLNEQEMRHRAWQSALRLLSYRPRSEAEMVQRLTRRGLLPDIVALTVNRLKEQGLLDDAAFSRFWVESHRERGSRRLERELALKGVDKELSRAATATRDDTVAALAAAQRRLPVLRNLDYATFQRRLGSYLVRRGFPYEVVRQVLEKCWRQREAR